MVVQQGAYKQQHDAHKVGRHATAAAAAAGCQRGCGGASRRGGTQNKAHLPAPSAPAGCRPPAPSCGNHGFHEQGSTQRQQTIVAAPTARTCAPHSRLHGLACQSTHAHPQNCVPKPLMRRNCSAVTISRPPKKSCGQLDGRIRRALGGTACPARRQAQCCRVRLRKRQRKFARKVHSLQAGGCLLPGRCSWGAPSVA